MKWFALPRTPETEVMNDAEGVEAYASATAQAHLDAIDNTLVDQLSALAPDDQWKGWLLDVGTGPGNIPLKMARRWPGLRVVGVDFSAPMIRAARIAAAAQGLAQRSYFLVADGECLPFPDATFGVVLTNSVLHHLPNPVKVMNEMARLAKPEGTILARDLRRPSRLAFPWHVRWHGRHYSGTMKKLFCDSVRAAYTAEELCQMLSRSALAKAQLFFHRRTHLGFVRHGRRKKN